MSDPKHFQEHLVEAEPCLWVTVRALFPGPQPVLPRPQWGLWVANHLFSTWPPLTPSRHSLGWEPEGPTHGRALGPALPTHLFLTPPSVPPSPWKWDVLPGLLGHKCMAREGWGTRVGELQRNSQPSLCPFPTMLSLAPTLDLGLQGCLRVDLRPEKTRPCNQGLSEVVAGET